MSNLWRNIYLVTVIIMSGQGAVASDIYVDPAIVMGKLRTYQLVASHISACDVLSDEAFEALKGDQKALNDAVYETKAFAQKLLSTPLLPTVDEVRYALQNEGKKKLRYMPSFANKGEEAEDPGKIIACMREEMLDAATYLDTGELIVRYFATQRAHLLSYITHLEPGILPFEERLFLKGSVEDYMLAIGDVVVLFFSLCCQRGTIEVKEAQKIFSNIEQAITAIEKSSLSDTKKSLLLSLFDKKGVGDREGEVHSVTCADSIYSSSYSSSGGGGGGGSGGD